MSNHTTFQMLIRPNFFVPNIADRFHNNRRVHSLAFGKCNYRCEFCSFGDWPVEKYPEYTLESFEQTIWKLLRTSRNFKFTGGEPTLNPYLQPLLRIVKMYGGSVFLDTNGSNPRMIQMLLKEGLIDILGLSLKGLSPEEAAQTANITNTKLCWENVFQTLAMAHEAGVDIVVTYVACDGYFTKEDFERLAKLLQPYPNITLKINNCYLEERIDYRRKGLPKDEIAMMVQEFVEAHEEYKGRTVLFKDHDSCLDESKITLY